MADDRVVTLRRALICGLLGFGALWAVAAVLMEIEVLETGALLSDSATDEVHRVQMIGGVEVFVSTSIAPEPDVANGLVLALLAGMALAAAVAVQAAGAAGRLVWFFGLLAAGAGMLAADEVLELLETVGYNLPFLSEVPLLGGPKRLDAVVYPVPALLFLWVFRDIVLSSLAAMACWALAIGVLGVSTLLDVVGLGYGVEERVEVLGSILLVAGAAALIAGRLRLSLRAYAPVGASS